MRAATVLGAAWARRWREPARRNGLIFSLVVLGGLGFLPQLGGPGYDAALVSGLCLPGVAAVVAALECARERALPSVAVARGASLGAVLAITGFLLLLLHGARVGFCDPSEGLWIFVLGPGFGAVLGGVWGGVAGLVADRLGGSRALWQRRTLTVALALAGPIGGVAVSLYRFVSSPMVFAFDPFFGVFSGPLYDTVVNVVDRLLTYRWGTLATLTAVALGASVWERGRDAGWRAALTARPGTALLAVSAAVLSLVHSASGAKLGHWSTAASIAEALGGHRAGRRCDVLHARSLAARDIEIFTRDCDARVTQVEAYFGARGPERIVVYLFANEGEKGWLMGASHTYIAKPWRREVYVQGAQFPHPVLSHELAHVIAGSFGSGPFRVAGMLGGIWPDPGRIEGFAVAAAPDETDELTTLEWAASMAKLGILPPLRSVFQLDFLSITASKAYTVAGAFVTFLRERYGAEALRRWYGGASIPAVFGGKDLPELEREFHAALAKLDVPERALLTAKARFEQPAFFARHCPRIVDRAVGEANQRLGTGDTAGALEGFRGVLGLDPHNLDARFGLVNCARKAGETDAAVAGYLALSRSIELPKPQLAYALETSADIELARGRGFEAYELYTRALELVFDEDRRRTLEVKRSVAPSTRVAPDSPKSARARAAVVALLIGTPESAPGWDVAAPLVQAWADAEPESLLPPYLIGRNLMNAARYAEAMPYLDRSLAAGFAPMGVTREAVRLRLVAGCALGPDPARQALLERALSERGLPAARRLGLERFVARCPGSPVNVTPAAVSAPNPQPKQDRPSDACPASMRRIPGGKFWVGSEPDDGFAADESPRYLTELPAFCMDATEVTADAYAACVATGACQVPEKHGILCNYGRPERGDHPINCVTWAAAEAYCQAEGARLPSEVELEYVARGGEKYSKYPWGDAPPDEHACWKHAGTCRVKSFPPDAFGLSDVSGNVWEWGADWYGPYPWPQLTGYSKVYRGGSFSRRFEKWMHTRLRNRAAPNDAGAHLGFRCAKALASEPCPFGEESAGVCRHGVLERSCVEGKSFNGVRCAAPGEPECGEGWTLQVGHGCVLRVPEEATGENVEASVSAVKSQRTREFDPDCQKNSRDRPHAFRYLGGSHAARNLVSRRSGCKNRDVGVGWNSTCCP